jgi:hypothetical protein
MVLLWRLGINRDMLSDRPGVQSLGDPETPPPCVIKHG